MKQILLTGFAAFGGATSNPSGEIVKNIVGDNIVTAILPVSYEHSARELLELIKQYQPAVVLCLGQAQSRKEITVERVAINLDDARLADNDGITHNDVVINANGPTAHFSTLPIKEMVTASKASGAAASVSLTAGAFICNNIFYSMQQALQGTNVRSGFVHVPIMDIQASEFPGMPTMPLEVMVKGVKAMLEVL